jgi:DNA-binding CsgD family transcriptional regulator
MNSRSSRPVSDSTPFDACKHAAEGVQTIDAFKEWTRVCVRSLVPHGALACVYGRTYGGGVSLDYVLTVDYPTGHLQEIRNSSGHMDTPLAHLWYAQQAPVFFDANDPPAYASASWLASFRKHGLQNAAAHGVLDQDRCIATYFSFHQLPILDETVLLNTFQTLVPLMHDTFARAIHLHQEGNGSLPCDYAGLTKRDREMVAYISQGKSNAEIASLLHLSEHTIRNRVSRILEMTGCSNRAALAAAAIAQEQERFGVGTKIL